MEPRQDGGARACVGSCRDADIRSVVAFRRARPARRREFARRLPAGSAGDAAIFTDRVKAAHMIRKVLLRQIAIMNYVLPF